MREAEKSLQMRRLLGVAVLLQWIAAATGTTLAPHPPTYYPVADYLVSDVLFGLSLIPLFPVLRRGGWLARSVAVLLCLVLSVHIVRSVQLNGSRMMHEFFNS